MAAITEAALTALVEDWTGELFGAAQEAAGLPETGDETPEERLAWSKIERQLVLFLTDILVTRGATVALRDGRVKGGA
jgi:hypothetical protein